MKYVHIRVCMYVVCWRANRTKIYPWYMYLCVGMYVYMYECMYECMYVCMYTYVYTYVCNTYIYTCYVLISPPIPYITSSRCKRGTTFTLHFFVLLCFGLVWFGLVLFSITIVSCFRKKWIVTRVVCIKKIEH